MKSKFCSWDGVRFLIINKVQKTPTFIELESISFINIVLFENPDQQVCVSAKNVISFDRLCWTVDAYNPVPIDKYNVVFSDVNIGCPCGEQDADGDYLGDGQSFDKISRT